MNICQCPYTNAHLFRSETELELHCMVCMFNPRPRFSEYWQLRQ